MKNAISAICCVCRKLEEDYRGQNGLFEEYDIEVHSGKGGQFTTAERHERSVLPAEGVKVWKTGRSVTRKYNKYILNVLGSQNLWYEYFNPGSYAVA